MAEPLTLTDAAAKRVAWIAERQNKPAMLRLSVEGGGCSGFQYKFDLADTVEGDDSVACWNRHPLTLALSRSGERGPEGAAI